MLHPQAGGTGLDLEQTVDVGVLAPVGPGVLGVLGVDFQALLGGIQVDGAVGLGQVVVDRHGTGTARLVFQGGDHVALGIQQVDGAQVGNPGEFFQIRRSWLTNSKYTFVDTVTYTNLYSPYSVSSSAATRSTAWRRWDFVSTPEATHVYIDGSHVYTSEEFNMGLSQIRFEGDWAFVETFCFDNVSFIKTDDGVDLPYPFPGPFSVSSLLANQSFFPFAVWDQPSYLAEFYKNISINLFIANGLSGETDEIGRAHV